MDNSISAADIAKALSECTKFPENSRLYISAPKGARNYIALVFYAEYFKDSVNADAYMELLNQVCDELDVNDLKYLYANEEDPELKQFFEDRLTCLGERPDPEPIRVVPVPAPVFPAQGMVRTPEELSRPSAPRRTARSVPPPKFSFFKFDCMIAPKLIEVLHGFSVLLIILSAVSFIVCALVEIKGQVLLTLAGIVLALLTALVALTFNRFFWECAIAVFKILEHVKNIGERA